MQVMVMGAGGMGALFGAILAKGGMETMLVDHDPEHVAAIRQNGLRISGYGGERVQPMQATTDAGEIDKTDIVLVQCKGVATAEAARAMRHLATGDTVFISFQNGLGNEEILADILGHERVLGGLTAMAGARLGPGHIRDFSRVPSAIGEMQGGISPRATAIAEAFSAAGLETHASGDIRADIWKKLVGNMAMSAVSGLTDLTSAQALAVPGLGAVCREALDEALSIAASQGVRLDRDKVIAGFELITEAGGTGDNKSSLCLDLQAARPSEVEQIYGSALRLADAAGLAVPTLRALCCLVRGVESHQQPETAVETT